MADELRVEHRFTYHAPKDGQPERYVAIRNRAKELALLIESECPSSRERTIAVNKLDECVMWANASIARNE
jgi:hypothetical protein